MLHLLVAPAAQVRLQQIGVAKSRDLFAIMYYTQGCAYMYLHVLVHTFAAAEYCSVRRYTNEQSHYQPDI